MRLHLEFIQMCDGRMLFREIGGSSSPQFLSCQYLLVSISSRRVGIGLPTTAPRHCSTALLTRRRRQSAAVHSIPTYSVPRKAAQKDEPNVDRNQICCDTPHEESVNRNLNDICRLHRRIKCQLPCHQAGTKMTPSIRRVAMCDCRHTVGQIRQKYKETSN